MKSSKREIGTLYEEKASDYLEDRGFEIIERNFRCKLGEIDIIAKKGGYIHFIEVKYRRESNYGNPLEAVNYKKQRIISRVALVFMSRNGLENDTPVSFDVISILGEKTEFFENAFEFVGY